MSNEQMVVEIMNAIRDNRQLVARCRCKLKLWGDDLAALSGVLLHEQEHTTVETPLGRGVRIQRGIGPKVVNQMPSVDEIARTLDELRKAQDEIAEAQQTLAAMGYAGE